jgi:histidinol dehydrogenase
MMRILEGSDARAIGRLLGARKASAAEAEAVARRILEDVRDNGDRALIRLTKKYDAMDLRAAGFTVTREEIRRARRTVPRELLEALRAAARSIRAVARRQLPSAWQVATRPGVKIGQTVRPLERVACYVPGGHFALPSTVLMSVIPAQVAGVREILLTSPRPAPAVLAAADLLGINRIFRLGGAQAVAAFAYGTESVPRADKIVGPGNRYVAAAQKLLAGECGIDFVAGPTELVVVGSRGRPRWIAADLVAQAEHDVDATAIFITSSRRLAAAVQAEVHSILTRLRLPVAARALARQGAIVVMRNLSEAAELANTLAPEHLTLLDDANGLMGGVRAAGAVFLGGASPVAAGDYASGSNHILPTGGAARRRGGLSAADFVKTISFQRLAPRGLAGLRSTIDTLAQTEGLAAHAYSVYVRFEPPRSAKTGEPKGRASGMARRRPTRSQDDGATAQGS